MSKIKENFEVPENVAEDLYAKNDGKELKNKSADEQDIVEVIADLLYVRSKPSKESSPLLVLNKEDKLLTDKSFENEEWLKVTTMNGENGFVMKKFVK